MTIGNQPSGASGSNTAVEVQAIRTAVKGGRWFVKTRLGRHGADGFRGHVGRIDHEQLDLAAQPRRQGIEQVPRMHLAAHRPNVSPGTPNSRTFDVRGMQFHPRSLMKDGCSHGTGPATEVNDNGGCRRVPLRQQRQCLGDQQLGPTPGDKDTRLHHNAAAGKFRPAQDEFQGDACHAALDVPGKVSGS